MGPDGTRFRMTKTVWMTTIAGGSDKVTVSREIGVCRGIPRWSSLRCKRVSVCVHGRGLVVLDPGMP